MWILTSSWLCFKCFWCRRKHLSVFLMSETTFSPYCEVAVSLLCGLCFIGWQLMVTLSVFRHSNHKVKTRARQEFIAGSKKIMLYSERVYFLLGCNKVFFLLHLLWLGTMIRLLFWSMTASPVSRSAA